MDSQDVVIVTETFESILPLVFHQFKTLLHCKKFSGVNVNLKF